MLSIESKKSSFLVTASREKGYLRQMRSAGIGNLGWALADVTRDGKSIMWQGRHRSDKTLEDCAWKVGDRMELFLLSNANVTKRIQIKSISEVEEPDEL